MTDPASQIQLQYLKIPKRKSNPTVTAAESSNDPRQPKRLEKKKNMMLALNAVPVAAWPSRSHCFQRRFAEVVLLLALVTVGIS
jgi:hypothetical protein